MIIVPSLQCVIRSVEAQNTRPDLVMYNRKYSEIYPQADIFGRANQKQSDKLSTRGREHQNSGIKYLLLFNICFCRHLLRNIITTNLTIEHNRVYQDTHTRTQTQTATHTVSHSLTHTHTHSLSLTHKHTHSLSLTHTHTHTRTHARTHKHTHSLSLAHTHSLTHTHTHTHTHVSVS